MFVCFRLTRIGYGELRVYRDKMCWVSLGWVGLFCVALIRVRSVWDRLKVPWACLKYFVFRWFVLRFGRVHLPLGLV
jgi:hypothetical protein